MKWIPIDKAKVKFDTQYLLFASDVKEAASGTLKEVKKTAEGVSYCFVVDYTDGKAELNNPTHIAIITDPNKE